MSAVEQDGSLSFWASSDVKRALAAQSLADGGIPAFSPEAGIIRLEADVAERLRACQRPGESIPDCILRLIHGETPAIGVNMEEQARRYVREARNGQGAVYGRRYQKQLRRWFIAGWRDEPGRWRAETNFEAPLVEAYRAGRAAIAQIGRNS